MPASVSNSEQKKTAEIPKLFPPPNLFHRFPNQETPRQKLGNDDFKDTANRSNISRAIEVVSIDNPEQLVAKSVAGMHIISEYSFFCFINLVTLQFRYFPEKYGRGRN